MCCFLQLFPTVYWASCFVITNPSDELINQEISKELAGSKVVPEMDQCHLTRICLEMTVKMDSRTVIGRCSLHASLTNWSFFSRRWKFVLWCHGKMKVVWNTAVCVRRQMERRTVWYQCWESSTTLHATSIKVETRSGMFWSPYFVWWTDSDWFLLFSVQTLGTQRWSIMSSRTLLNWH